MKKIVFQAIKLIALFAISFGIVMYAKENLINLFNNRVDAAGALTFNIGVPNGQPIFSFNNIAPGFSQTHTITANNGDSLTRTAGVKGVKTSSGILDEALLIEIKQNGTTLYGPKKLSEFFADSQTINGITLSNISQGASAQYAFIVTFDTTAGNVYQNQTLTFDLTFGIISADIPAACEGIKFSKTIYGTAENDTLRGTVGNDLIIALEGNDTIDSGVGNDCIVAGAGNDTIDAGVGNDVIDAGDGNDTVRAGVGNDTAVGGAGDDRVYGDVGNDVLYGNDGNDQIWGGVGDDTIQGDAGNDTMFGEVGNDTLIGGDGIDSATGAVGRDRCEAEVKNTCEL
ncbi:MAG TPA: calcium-binding protein [Candidatus Levybacteria bacterium]|nr:calcium-binding protein [Candidatus Levybacteria bacterium]